MRKDGDHHWYGNQSTNVRIPFQSNRNRPQGNSNCMALAEIFETLWLNKIRYLLPLSSFSANHFSQMRIELELPHTAQTQSVNIYWNEFRFELASCPIRLFSVIFRAHIVRDSNIYNGSLDTIISLFRSFSDSFFCLSEISIRNWNSNREMIPKKWKNQKSTWALQPTNSNVDRINE